MMENIDKRVDITLLTDKEKAIKLVAKPNYDRITIFDENLIAIQMRKSKVYYTLYFFSSELQLDFHRSAVADQQIGDDAVTRRRRLVGRRRAGTAALDHVDSCTS